MDSSNTPTSSSEKPSFTCLSCSIGFFTAEEQRIHYRSDHHRYNMKRRVASLPPVSVTLFNQKVLERRQETAVMQSSKGTTCETCNKAYTTENAYRSHVQSKKHKENEIKAASRPKQLPSENKSSDEVPSFQAEPIVIEVPKLVPGLTIAEDASEEEINQTIDEKIAAARSRLSPNHCLFCAHTSPEIADNLTHMSISHSFFIPDAEFLVDLHGLITYLGEKIAVGNVCLYCNGKGREFRTLHAVRKHMVDKSHCKIAYDTEKEKIEISDFYDFTTSYPEPRASKSSSKTINSDADGWEDVSDEGSADEVVEESGSDTSESEESESDSLPEENPITYGDSPYELVLPSGARIGHRTMKRYYAQTFLSNRGQAEDPKSGAALVRRLLADKNSALIPRKGGWGAYGTGTEVIKARNRGEAREAGRHVREFRDQKRREDFKTKVGFIGNAQKHYRDPLLQ